MQNHIQHKFLELDDFRPNANARFPPSVRVEIRIAFGFNHDARRMAFHVSIDHPAYSSGVIPCGHEHDGVHTVLLTPWRKNPALTSASCFLPGNLRDIRYTKPSQLANLPCGSILVGEPPAYELEIFASRWICKDRNPRRDAALHEVRRLQRAGAARIARD